MGNYHLLSGQVLLTDADPFSVSPEQALRIEADWAVLLQGGHIAAVGPAEALRVAHPEAAETRYGTDLICPGFVDAHVHYPQTAIIASWGRRLIDWLNDYTFPEEARFESAEYAQAQAERYLDLTAAHGTTTVCSYCTTAPISAEALFAEAARRDQRVFAGKTCMDRNAPVGLVDTAQRAYDESRALLERWHGVGRAAYVITPRFAPTSSAAQLEALGALWAEHPDCLMQTHLSEQTEEIAWVAELFPKARDYLDVYERFGLLGGGAVYGHAIHLRPREIARLKEVGAALVHCPTSNTFIGSGIFDMAARRADQLRVGLASDTGGGSSFSMLRTMAAAYEIGQLSGTALHPAQLLWLATAGSAEALCAGDRIGRLARGLEADVTVLDLSSTAAISQRAGRAETDWEAIFPTIMMGDDRAIRDVWIGGRRVKGA